ncbi:hypothetical protein KKA93_02735 [Patescibacteria group bacterium]|nr:hypothetical protein [Patescibacteria group bacterium]MBU1663735.1 hypothetical protein [Patescibacteria group bacterium]MBU1934287.1 hypothetical protein [Patescibacteria group bacterium]MBU2007504.1 hypothetical protein [Patescibacteria group bacterium]MBU2233294.1 hypothetical protein [Patescibacteria group bacterium]
MPSINNSYDLLNIVIALSVLLFTIFSCWAIYYLVRILRQFFKVIEQTRDRLNKFDELLKMVKEKIESSTSYLPLIGEGVKKLVEIIKNRAKKKKSTKKE